MCISYTGNPFVFVIVDVVPANASCDICVCQSPLMMLGEKVCYASGGVPPDIATTLDPLGKPRVPSQATSDLPYMNEVCGSRHSNNTKTFVK